MAKHEAERQLLIDALEKTGGFSDTINDIRSHRVATVPAWFVMQLLADYQQDAERWRALMSSDRIRMMGAAGFNYASDGSVTVLDAHYQHMGVEVWNRHQGGGDTEDTRGRKVLLAYVDHQRKQGHG